MISGTRILVLGLILRLAVTSTSVAILPPEHTEEFFVSDFNNDRVVIYGGTGAYTNDFTAEGLDGPRGVVVDPSGRVYVASELSNEILMFNTSGDFQASFSHPHVQRPTGMAMHDGELFVSSFAGDQIVVFDADGTYSRSFSGGDLNGPNCVAFDSEGNIYVASALTASILKFNSDEDFVTSFTGGGLSSPMGIARDENDTLYVAGGGSSNIVRFDTGGNYLGEIRHPDLFGPQGVAFDDRGHMFSSSFFRDNVVEFDTEGEYVQTITAGGLDIPRSIAFVPTLLALTPGDFDGNGVLDATDIDLLSQAVQLGTFDESFDLTGDGTLSDQDHRHWVDEIAGTRAGDTDLNGSVDFADFLVLSQNFGIQGGWSVGDFDGDGAVAFPDFLSLSQNFGLGAATGVRSVPEPICRRWTMVIPYAVVTLSLRNRRACICKIFGPQRLRLKLH